MPSEHGRDRYEESKQGTLQPPAALTSLPITYNKLLHFSADGPAFYQAVEAIHDLSLAFHIGPIAYVLSRHLGSHQDLYKTSFKAKILEAQAGCSEVRYKLDIQAE